MSFTVIIFRQNTILKHDSESDFPCEIPKNLKHFLFREDRGGVVKSRADNDITFLVRQYLFNLEICNFLSWDMVEETNKK